MEERKGPILTKEGKEEKRKNMNCDMEIPMLCCCCCCHMVKLFTICLNFCAELTQMPP